MYSLTPIIKGNNQKKINLSLIFLFFEVIELVKSVITLIFSKKKIKNFISNSFPTTSFFVKQYKKTIHNFISSLQNQPEISLELKFNKEFFGLFKKQGNSLLKKKTLENLGIQDLL